MPRSWRYVPSSDRRRVNLMSKNLFPLFSLIFFFSFLDVTVITTRKVTRSAEQEVRRLPVSACQDELCLVHRLEAVVFLSQHRYLAGRCSATSAKSTTWAHRQAVTSVTDKCQSTQNTVSIPKRKRNATGNQHRCTQGDPSSLQSNQSL